MVLESVESNPEALTPVVARQYVRFVGDQPETVDAGVIGEIRFTIFVQERELVTLMCSPWQLRSLVVGFLYLEGLIESIDDLEMLRVCLAVVTGHSHPPLTETPRLPNRLAPEWVRED